MFLNPKNIAKNTDCSTGPLARPFARSLAPLPRSLAPDCLLRSRPPLRSLARSLRSLPRSWDSELLDGYLICVFFYSGPQCTRATSKANTKAPTANTIKAFQTTCQTTIMATFTAFLVTSHRIKSQDTVVAKAHHLSASRRIKMADVTATETCRFSVMPPTSALLTRRHWWWRLVPPRRQFMMLFRHFDHRRSSLIMPGQISV